MGLVKIENKRKIKKVKVEDCSEHINSSDCMFRNKKTGKCRGEWCIYKELPKLVDINVELTCEVCKKNKTTVSVYSGETKYICDDCLDKLYTVIKDPTCDICGTSIPVNRSICTACAAKIKALYTHSHPF